MFLTIASNRCKIPQTTER